MDINTDNITALLKEQIAKFEGSVDVSEVGEIISVGEGVSPVSDGVRQVQESVQANFQFLLDSDPEVIVNLLLSGR